MKNTVYLDNSATTPVCRAAREAAIEAFDAFGNPSSLHTLGQSSERLVRQAREKILASLGVRRDVGALVFTSCGTEATSLALLGTARAKTRREATRILTTDSEHPATARALDVLASEGFEIVKIPTKNGVFDMDALCASLDKKIFLATFMLVNNETGAMYSVSEAFERIKRAYPAALTHCDAIQGFMRVGFTPASLHADMISISGHKIGAPKGVGALYINKEIIRSKRIVPFLVGGGQESGMRSGTENVVGICAFGAATEQMSNEFAENTKKLEQLYTYASEKLEALGVRMNVPGGRHVHHIINLTLPDIKSETMLHHLSSKGIYVSSGSACSSHASTPSEALVAFGISARDADCSIRVSFSPDNTIEDIDALCDGLSDGMERLVKIRR